jgi:hypothetical protein
LVHPAVCLSGARGEFCKRNFGSKSHSKPYDEVITEITTQPFLRIFLFLSSGQLKFGGYLIDCPAVATPSFTNAGR